MLTILRSMTIAVIFVLAVINSAVAANSVHFHGGYATVGSEGLVLHSDEAPFNVIVSWDESGFVLVSDSEVQEPVGFLDTGNENIRLNFLGYTFKDREWYGYTGSEDVEIRFDQEDVRIFIPQGTISLNDQKVLVIDTGYETKVYIRFDMRTNQWFVNESR